MNRALAYGSGATASSSLYVVWLVTRVPHEGVDLKFRIAVAFFFWLVDGFGLALAVLGAPWILAVKLYPKWRWPGWIYFASIGALLTFAIACTTASLAPKPLFIEDQTFFEGARIAAERAGVCFGLGGMLHGIIYWFIGEQRLWSRR